MTEVYCGDIGDDDSPNTVREKCHSCNYIFPNLSKIFLLKRKGYCKKCIVRIYDNEEKENFNGTYRYMEYIRYFD